MKSILLAAGYGTRLYPLTLNTPKPLLRVGSKPIVEHLLEKVWPLEEVEEVYVVTNARFAAAFQEWAEGRSFPKPLHILNDGTTTNETRLGAIGDAAFVVRQAHWEGQDLLILAGDNLFTFGLEGFLDFFRQKQATVVGLYEFHDIERIKQYSAVEVDETGRILSYEEKPSAPRTNLVGIALYLLARKDVPLLLHYADMGDRERDAPGYFIQWLCQRTTVYGYRFEGLWLDVGTFQSLKEAEELFS